MSNTYGAKCHRCADVLGSSHDRPEIHWLMLQGRECPTCSFCQERALSRLIGQVGLDVFDPEVRTAVRAFRKSEPHPLIDKLRTEIQMLDATHDAGVDRRDEGMGSEAFRREYLGQWPTQLQRCEVKTTNDRCPNVAEFVLSWRDKTGHVCTSCLTGWIELLTERGQPVTVERRGRRWQGGGR